MEGCQGNSFDFFSFFCGIVKLICSFRSNLFYKSTAPWLLLSLLPSTLFYKNLLSAAFSAKVCSFVPTPFLFTLILERFTKPVSFKNTGTLITWLVEFSFKESKKIQIWNISLLVCHSKTLISCRYDENRKTADVLRTYSKI